MGFDPELQSFLQVPSSNVTTLQTVIASSILTAIQTLTQTTSTTLIISSVITSLPTLSTLTTLPSTVTSQSPTNSLQTRSTPLPYPPTPSDDIPTNTCPSPLKYQYAVAILSTIIAVTLLLLAFVFGYMKPKKWQKKGAASRDAEMEQLKKENEEIRGLGGARYERIAGVPVAAPPMGMPSGMGMGMGMGPRGFW